jgi:AcrR family transcriptional regulator
MDIFEKLSEEKQKAVLNAAFLCFSKNGYKKASVADVATMANISKASVFQYFGTKKELYLYLFEYACEKIINETHAGNDDFFDCIRIGTEIKVSVMKQYPGMLDFLSSIVNETDDEILSELHKRANCSVDEIMMVLFSNVNWGKFKPEVDRHMVVNTVMWVGDGYLKSVIGHKDTDDIIQEFMRYLDMLKNSFYREEEL